MWDDICFTTRPGEECDLLVTLNNRRLDPETAQWRVWVGEWDMEVDAPRCVLIMPRQAQVSIAVTSRESVAGGA